MANSKIIFKEDGTTKIIENYIPSEEEINELKAYDAALAKDKAEEDQVDESEMSIKEIKAWTKAKALGENYEEFNKHFKENKASSKALENTKSKNLPPRSKKTGRQKSRQTIRGNDAVLRTYIMELQSVQKLEEIKVLHYHNEYIQYSEIINEAVDYYYNLLKCKKN